MKNKILIILSLFITGCTFQFSPVQAPTPPPGDGSGWNIPTDGELSTQGIRPDQAPAKNPANTDAIYTQESGTLNKVRFDSAKFYFQPKILSTQLAYAIDTTSTDNPDSLRGYIVTDVNGNKFYIDSTRLGIRLNPPSGASAQTLSFSSPNLSISSGNSIDISGIDTDNQTLSVDSTATTYSITIEDGNSISFAKAAGSTDNQTIDTFDLSGNNLRLSLEDDGEAAQTVDLSGYLDNTDDQTIDVFQLNGNNLELSLESDGQATQTVDLSGYLDNTDAQTLSFASPNLSISGGNSIDISGIDTNDGVSTAGTFDDANNELDITVTGGTNFSIDINAVMDSIANAKSFADSSGTDFDMRNLIPLVQQDTFGNSSNISINLQNKYSADLTVDLSNKSGTVTFNLPTNPQSGGSYLFYLINPSSTVIDFNANILQEDRSTAFDSGSTITYTSATIIWCKYDSSTSKFYCK